jgi:hypothetical protein
MKSLAATALLLSVFATSASAQWSIDIAGTREVQYGTFIAPCGCTFQPSAGWGFDGALQYDIFANQPFTIGAAAGVHYMRYTSYEEPNNKDSSDLATIGMTYLTVEPSVRWTIANSPLSLRLGANVGLLMNNTYHHETHPIPDPEEDVDSSMGDLRTLRLAARVSAGYAIPVGTFVIVPTLGVEVPLNTIRDENASNWRVVTYLAGVGIRFR